MSYSLQPPWAVACQASLCFTTFQSFLKFMSIESVMLSNHLILCYPLLLLSIFPSIRVFPNESALCISWPKYWRFSFSFSPSYEYQGWFPLGLTGLNSLLSKGLLHLVIIWKLEDIRNWPGNLYGCSALGVQNEIRIFEDVFGNPVKSWVHLNLNTFGK